jgi:hypothetical protein
LGKPVAEVKQSGIAWTDWFSETRNGEIASRPDVDTDSWSLGGAATAGTAQVNARTMIGRMSEP